MRPFIPRGATAQTKKSIICHGTKKQYWCNKKRIGILLDSAGSLLESPPTRERGANPAPGSISRNGSSNPALSANPRGGFGNAGSISRGEPALYRAVPYICNIFAIVPIVFRKLKKRTTGHIVDSRLLYI